MIRPSSSARNAALLVLVSVAAVWATPTPLRTSAVPHLIRVPLCRQATDYTCGAAALQSVLGYYGEDFREDVLARALHADRREGVNYREIARFARARGFHVNTETAMTVEAVEALIDRGIPVIVLLQAWPDKKVDYVKDWDDGHYAVVVGHDDSRLYFMDPSTLGHYTYIPKPNFVKRWHDREGRHDLVHFGMTLRRSGLRFDPEGIRLME